MSKANKMAGTSFNRAARRQTAIDNLAGWLARQSRLIRSLIAAVIALVLAGVVALIIYGLVLEISPGSYTYFTLNRFNILTGLFGFCVVLGLVFYWVGWRLMIGFGFGEASLEPGRPAALWVIFGLVVLITSLIVLALVLISALQ